MPMPSVTAMKNAVAANFPATSAPREAGNVSSGSSDPRSRSPAVESTATCTPPSRQAKSRKYVNMPSSSTERPDGVDTSSESTAIGRATVGSTPRNCKRRTPTSLL